MSLGYRRDLIVNPELIKMEVIGCSKCELVCISPSICKHCKKVFCYKCLSEYVNM